MSIEKIQIKSFVRPEKIIHKGSVYKIINYPTKYFIKGYQVTLVDGKLLDVHINGKHPNALPSSGEFCIPTDLRRVDFNDSVKSMLELVMSQYNLDSCYFTPWNEIYYKKQEV